MEKGKGIAATSVWLNPLASWGFVFHSFITIIIGGVRAYRIFGLWSARRCPMTASESLKFLDNWKWSNLRRDQNNTGFKWDPPKHNVIIISYFLVLFYRNPLDASDVDRKQAIMILQVEKLKPRAAMVFSRKPVPPCNWVMRRRPRKPKRYKDAAWVIKDFNFAGWDIDTKMKWKIYELLI